MIEASESIVIGSGALGASVAFHLARGGRQVALVDKHALGSQTSPRAAGLTSQARGTDLMTTLAKRAVRKIEAFERETGEAIVFYQPGALKVARIPAHVAQLRSEPRHAVMEPLPGWLERHRRQYPPAADVVSRVAGGPAVEAAGRVRA